MAKAAGRLAVLSKGGTPIGGVRVTTLKFGSQAIDVSDRDSGEFIELLGTVTGRQITMSVSGIYDDPVLRDIAADPSASQILSDLTFKFSDALAAKDTISGTFHFSDYEDGNPYEDATTFTANFASSGAWTLG
jgi:predicted secreted protein